MSRWEYTDTLERISSWTVGNLGLVYVAAVVIWEELPWGKKETTR